MTASSKTDIVKLKFYMDTKADNIRTNKCQNAENTNTNTTLN